MTILSLTMTKITTKIKNESEQKTNGICVNNIKFNCDEYISDYIDTNNTN